MTLSLINSIIPIRVGGGVLRQGRRGTARAQPLVKNEEK